MSDAETIRALRAEVVQLRAALEEAVAARDAKQQSLWREWKLRDALLLLRHKADWPTRQHMADYAAAALRRVYGHKTPHPSPYADENAAQTHHEAERIHA